jgi:aminodeoxyfutalosine deaminase
MAISIRARVVFPVDRPPIEHGVVTIEGERIVDIGTTASARDVIDLGSAALFPGFVNAHTHLEFSHLRQPLGTPGMSLVDWIRLVIAERGRGDRSLRDSLIRGAQESIAAGVTAVGDIATGLPDIPLDLIDSTNFHEVIGFSRARAASAFSAIVDRLDGVERALAVMGPEACTGLRNGISPHAPYTVSPKLVSDLVSLSRQRNMPMAMHLAESREELELLRDGTGPFQVLLDERSMWDADAIPRDSRPLDYLRLLADAPRTLVIHGNYLDSDELAFLAANRERMSLVYCPRTHAYFEHAAYPLVEALAAGVRVAIGTDSRGSNPDLDLLAEMRHVWRAHPAVDPLTVLQLGTLSGAEALGRDTEFGSLTPGKLANLVAVSLPENARSEPSDLLAAILEGNDVVSAVWMRGESVSDAPVP